MNCCNSCVFGLTYLALSSSTKVRRRFPVNYIYFFIFVSTLHSYEEVLQGESKQQFLQLLLILSSACEILNGILHNC